VINTDVNLIKKIILNMKNDEKNTQANHPSSLPRYTSCSAYFRTKEEIEEVHRVVRQGNKLAEKLNSLGHKFKIFPVPSESRY